MVLLGTIMVLPIIMVVPLWYYQKVCVNDLGRTTLYLNYFIRKKTYKFILQELTGDFSGKIGYSSAIYNHIIISYITRDGSVEGTARIGALIRPNTLVSY